MRRDTRWPKLYCLFTHAHAGPAGPPRRPRAGAVTKETQGTQRSEQAGQHGQAAHKFAARQQLNRDLHGRVAAQVERLDDNAKGALPE